MSLRERDPLAGLRAGIVLLLLWILGHGCDAWLSS